MKINFFKQKIMRNFGITSKNVPTKDTKKNKKNTVGFYKYGSYQMKYPTLINVCF